MADLPERVRRFLQDHISSVMQLEVLLRLRNERDRSLSPMQLSRELGGSVDLVLGSLVELHRSGLVVQESGDDLLYRYQPKNPSLGTAVDEVAGAYAARKVAIVSEIFRPPDASLRNFSEAFRVRKDR
jgi:hypothetical protein